MSKKTNNKKYLRIAMLGHKRIPSREGGIEIVVEELGKRMVKLGHSVTCYNRSGHHVSGKEFDCRKNIDKYKGIKLKSVFTVNKKGLAAMTSSAIASLKVAFGKYDVVHFHAEGSCVMLWLPKLFGKRCIVTIHGLDHKRAKWGKVAGKYILLGERCAVKYADEIIVLSRGVRDYFKQTWGKNTRYIPNGVNRAEIVKADLIEKEYALKKDGYILYLGRIVPEKGISYLIDAFKKVSTDKKLVIAGGSSDTDDFMEELRKMAVEDDRIIFTGFVQGRILEELYSNAYVYCLPSDLEGMPLSLLEAMSYGNCCVVSNIPECAEVVEDKAVIFEKGNAEALRDNLQMLCNDLNMVEKYRSKAARYICGKYNWDDVVNETLNLYELQERKASAAEIPPGKTVYPKNIRIRHGWRYKTDGQRNT